MVSVSLYIDNVKVDLFNDENISLTQSIQNVRDISKVFANFTQTFTLPASKNNNQIFKHYYNYSIVNGFDARKKVDAKIELNYLPFQDGKIQLLGVNLKNNEVYAYKVVFYGNIVDLKDVLGEDKLSALTWLNNFSRPYSATNVLSDLQSDGLDVSVSGTIYEDALVMPLITNTSQLFYDSTVTPPPYFDADGEIDPLGANLVPSGNNGVYYEELKYGIRVWLIVKAIEETYDITFHPDSFLKKTDNPQYYDLYMWLHREKGFAFKATTVTDLYASFPLDPSQMTRVICTPSTLSVFDVPSSSIDYSLDVLVAPSADYTVAIYRNGTLYQQQSFPQNVTGTILSGPMSNGNYTVYVTSAPSTTIQLQWQISDVLSGNQEESGTFTGIATALSAGDSFNAQQQIPEIKIIDFLTGLFKMFNLTAYKLRDGSIMVETLDDYYAGGVLRRIDEYIDITDSQIDSALPFKEVIFEYTGRGTKLAQLFEQQQETGWGTEEYKVDNDFLGPQYRVDIPFEHMQFEKLAGTDVQTGYMIDDNDQAYVGAPLLFYRQLITGGTTISFLTSGVTFTTINSYCIPMNSVSTSDTVSNKVSHFFPETNEYSPNGTFNGTLFQEYYKNYIEDAFDTRRRLFKYKAILPVGFLNQYSLKDTLQIFDTPYIINQITTNLTTGESTLELLNVLDETFEITTTTTTIAPPPTTTTTSTTTTTTTLEPTTTTTLARENVTISGPTSIPAAGLSNVEYAISTIYPSTEWTVALLEDPSAPGYPPIDATITSASTGTGDGAVTITYAENIVNEDKGIYIITGPTNVEGDSNAIFVIQDASGVTTTTTAPPFKAQLQYCDGTQTVEVEFVNILQTLAVGSVIKGNGGTLNTLCWQVIDNAWTGFTVQSTETLADVYADCAECAAPPTTTTTQAPPPTTTTTAAPTTTTTTTVAPTTTTTTLPPEPTTTTTSTTTTTLPPAQFTLYGRTLIGSEFTAIYYTVNGGDQRTAYIATLDDTCNLLVTVTGLREGDNIVMYTNELESMGVQAGTSCPTTTSGTQVSFTLAAGSNDFAVLVDTGVTTTTTSTTTTTTTTSTTTTTTTIASCRTMSSTPYNYSYDASSATTACSSGVPVTVYTTGDLPIEGVVLYTDTSGCTTASGGYYSDGSGYFLVDGFGEIIGLGSCPATTTTAAPVTLTVYARTTQGGFINIQYAVNQGSTNSLFLGNLFTDCIDVGTITGLEDGDLVTFFEGTSDFISGTNSAGICPSTVGTSTAYDLFVGPADNYVSLNIDADTPPTTTTTLVWNSTTAAWRPVDLDAACNAAAIGSGPFYTVYWTGQGVAFKDATALYGAPDGYSQVYSGFYADTGSTGWVFASSEQGPPGSAVIDSGDCS